MTNATPEKIKSYKKDFDYSYTTGAFPTMELIKNRPELVRRVYLHSALRDRALFENACAERGIPFEYNDKVFQRLGVNDNSFVLGAFAKFQGELDSRKPHIVLVNPGDMGNLGTILRTCLGFGYRDLAIITPAADVFNPKAVRASMGALFHLNIRHFSDFAEYRAQFPEHACFPFMLDGARPLTPDNCPEDPLFSLIFGNESSGLAPDFASVGTTLIIPQSDAVDSLNLSIAVGIGAYTFAMKHRLVDGK